MHGRNLEILQYSDRGVPIIGSAIISATDMALVFTTNIGIGTEQQEDRYRYRYRYRYLYSNNSLYINGLCIGCSCGSLVPVAFVYCETSATLREAI